MIMAVLLATRLLGANADVDPNFYIYICFGQSNMEGNAQAESVDKSNVDKRFRLLATCNYDSPKRTLGQWYDAIPPLVNPVGGLGPTDYFGRTMVAALPANVRIGVIPVAMGGSPIEMFDKDKYQQKLKDNPNEWWAQIARNNYNSNPYGRIIEMAKKAQEVGVIKGILLHQGCSNNGDSNWPNMVKKIYNDMLKDLGLAADTVPLFVGETLRQENGGACYAHNTQVARMPTVVPTSHVVSSEGLPGNGQDPWHFSAVGYRILGKRYAFEALKLMNQELKADPDYTMTASLKKFYSVKKLNISDNVMAMPGQLQRLPVTATFEDNHTEDVTKDMTYISDDFDFNGSIFSPTTEKQGTAEACYTDFTRKETRQTINIDVRFFPFAADNITSLYGTVNYDEAARSITAKTAGGQAGWVYKNGVDMSAYKYLVVKLKEPQTCNAQIRVFNKNNINSASYKDTINSRTTIVIDLHNMAYNAAGATIDPSKIYIVSFRCAKAGTLLIDDVFLSNDDQLTGIDEIAQRSASGAQSAVTYDLQGRRITSSQLKKGIYIQNGRKVLVSDK